VIQSSVVDASGSDLTIINEALEANARNSQRYRYAYRVIAQKLNEYIRKYRSMSAVTDTEDAECIIYFKLVEYRRVLNVLYPYGELFIIVNQRPEDEQPARVVWKSRKVMWAEDAMRDFLQDLKRVRGER
jgi:hypothetical protein